MQETTGVYDLGKRPGGGRVEFPKEEERKEGTKEVIRAFESFGLEFKIENHPVLLERLADFSDHFHDAVEMARIIDRLWKKFGLKNEDRENMIVATLLHDIGKTGFKDIYNYTGSEPREIFRKFFPRKFVDVKEIVDKKKAERKKIVKNKKNGEKEEPESEPVATLGDVALLPEIGVNLKEFADMFPENQMEKYSSLFLEERGKDQKRNIVNARFRINEDMDMHDFWDMHVDWTYEILSEEPGLDPEVVKIASSHHILEGKNPMQLKEEEIPHQAKALEVTDKHRLLVLTDKIQAAMHRVKRQAYEPASYGNIIEKLKGFVERGEVSQKAKKDYYDLIDTAFAGEENERIIEGALAEDAKAA